MKAGPKMRALAIGGFLSIFLLGPTSVSHGQQSTQSSGGSLEHTNKSVPSILSISPMKAREGDKMTIIGIKGDIIQAVKIGDKSLNFIEVTPPKKVIGKAVEFQLDPIDQVGGKVEVEVKTDKGTFKVGFDYYPSRWSILSPRVGFPVLVFLIVVGIYFVKFGDLAFRSETGKLSLSKVQMSLWTVTFGGAYVWLASFWGEFLDITEGMFWLMGISSATAAGARAIVVKNIEYSTEAQQASRQAVEAWNQKSNSAALEHTEDVANLTGDQALLTEHNKLSALISAGTLGSSDVTKLVRMATNAAPPPSTLFCDWNQRSMAYTASLHRCQIALWTLIVWAIYLVNLFSTMHLPEIPNNLLILMGISGGTYLGFNIPKKVK